MAKKSVRQSLQIESIDKVLETKLWNNFLNDFLDKIYNNTNYGINSKQQKICKIIWCDFFEQRSDEIPLLTSGTVHVSSVIKYIKDWFFNSNWYEKYDFMEYISFLDYTDVNTNFTESCNSTLERESAGYRIVEHKIVQITSEEEILAIEDAINSSISMKSVETHLRTALEYLSSRENPDYRNSIKESISAVESFCKILTGDSTATLGKALNKIEKSHKIHGALRSAFTALYGYTSDSGGIRHSLLEDDIEVSMEDAKFMLVSCSAFINYLKAKE